MFSKEKLAQNQQEIVEIGQKIYARGMVAANDGNISVRLDKNHILITPTKSSKGFLTPEMLVVVDSEGKKVAGTGQTTSELLMHLAIYKEKPDLNAIVHCHPAFATAFALSGKLPPFNYMPEALLGLGEICLVPYAAPSTKELADAIAAACQKSQALLLANHGAVTVAKNLNQAYYMMESLEHICRIGFYAQLLGGPQTLSQEAQQKLAQIRQDLWLDK